MPCLQGVVPPRLGRARVHARPADRRRGRGRVIAERRHHVSGGRRSGQRPAIAQVPLLRDGVRRRPVRQVPPFAGGADGAHPQAHRLRWQPALVTAQVRPKPPERLVEQGRHVLVEPRRVIPRPHDQPRRTPGLAQPPVHGECRVEADIRPAGHQMSRRHPLRGHRCPPLCPERVVRRRMPQPLLEVADPLPEGRRIALDQRQRALHPPVRAQQPQDRQREPAEAALHRHHGGGPGQCGLQGEGAPGIEERAEVVGPDLYHHGAELGRRVGGQRPLGVAQVAGADRAQRAGEPVLPPQPGHGRLGVGGLVDERLVLAAGSAGAPAALQQDVEALLREQRPVHVIPREAAAVRAADEQRRARLVEHWPVVVGDQGRAVGGRHLQAPFHRDGAHRSGELASGQPQQRPHVPRQPPGLRRRDPLRHVASHRGLLAAHSRTSFAN